MEPLQNPPPPHGEHGVKTALDVREARPHELAVAARHYLGMRRELGWNDDAMRADWETLFVTAYEEGARAGDMRYFVAEADGAVVGSAVAMRVRAMADRYERAARSGYIANVYVERAHRRKGAARALTTAAMDWLRASGCAVVRLRASPYGRTLYESMGFTPSDEMELTL